MKKKPTKHLALTKPNEDASKASEALTLEAIERMIEQANAAEAASEIEGGYARAVRGLCYMKARAHFSAPGLRSDLGDDEKGYMNWLKRNHCALAYTSPKEEQRDLRRVWKKADRAICCAQSLGLTPEHSIDDLRKMRREKRLEKLLETKTLTQLSLPQKQEPLKLQDAQKPLVNIGADLVKNIRSSVDQLLVVHEGMETEVFEAAWTSLQDGLERLTGGTWIMANTTSQGAHGEVFFCAGCLEAAKRESKKVARKKVFGKV